MSFFSVKQKAWNALGLIVEDYPTGAEAIRYAGANSEVVKVHRSIMFDTFPAGKAGNWSTRWT